MYITDINFNKIVYIFLIFVINDIMNLNKKIIKNFYFLSDSDQFLHKFFYTSYNKLILVISRKYSNH